MTALLDERTKTLTDEIDALRRYVDDTKNLSRPQNGWHAPLPLPTDGDGAERLAVEAAFFSELGVECDGDIERACVTCEREWSSAGTRVPQLYRAQLVRLWQRFNDEIRAGSRIPGLIHAADVPQFAWAGLAWVDTDGRSQQAAAVDIDALVSDSPVAKTLAGIKPNECFRPLANSGRGATLRLVGLGPWAGPNKPRPIYTREGAIATMAAASSKPK